VKITSQKDLRRAFWEANPDLQRKAGWTQNDYPTDIRVAWCDYVFALAHDGLISEALAQRATL
jgi:hypothetical protein